jgi:hypothetical protein
MCSNVPIVVEKNLQKGINQGSLKNVDFYFMLFLLMFLLISIGEDFAVKNILLVSPGQIELNNQQGPRANFGLKFRRKQCGINQNTSTPVPFSLRRRGAGMR